MASRSVRMAGDMFDQAIIAFIKRKYNLLIGERTAEQIKIEIGSAYALDPELTMEIKGRNLVDGLPKNIVVHSEDVRGALLECLVKITTAIKETLERPAGTERRYHRPRHHLDRRRRSAARSGSVDPERDRH